MKHGKVYWMTGLSGAGKTTIGTLLFKRLKEKKDNVVMLDGDTLREVFGNDLGHTLEDRHKSAMRNARLCKLLSDQGIDVICCTISMFHDVRAWNRDNIQDYLEIYIKVPMEVLQMRDQKSLYSGVVSGTASNVYGMDMKVEEPLNPDICVMNDGTKTPEEILEMIMKEM